MTPQPGYIPTVFADSIEVYIGTPGFGRAVAGSTTLDLVQFTKMPGQSVASTFTPDDVGMPIAIIGGGPVDTLMPGQWTVQGSLFKTTVAAYVSPTQVVLADAPVTSIYNTAFVTVICYRPAVFQMDTFSASYSIAPGTRNPLKCTILSDSDYIRRFEVIANGQPVYVRSTDSRVGEMFGGNINLLDVVNQPGLPGIFAWNLTCVNYASAALRRVVNAVIPQILSGTGDHVFRRCVLLYLSNEGVAVQTDSTATSIDLACAAGAHIDQLLDQVVQKLSTPTEQWYWDVDVWRTYILRKRTTTPAPWDVTDGYDLLAGDSPIQIVNSYSHDQLATYVYGIADAIYFDEAPTRINGDGATTTFNLSLPIQKVPVITKNGGTPQTVGILGVETGKDWYWNQGSTALTQDSGGAVLSATDYLTVTYTITYSGVAQSPTFGSIQERSNIEANSGQYDYSFQVSVPIDPNELLARVIGYGTTYGTPPQAIKLSTLRPGLAVGQLQNITLPQAGVDGSFLIATVRMSIKQQVIQWDYTAFFGANTGLGITGLVQFINRGDATLTQVTASVPITAAAPADAVTGQNNIHQGIGSSVAFPNSVVAGDLLVLVVNRAGLLGNPPTVSDTQGNTWTQAQYGNTGPVPPFFIDNQLSILYAYASVSGSCTVTCNTAEWCAVMEFTSIAPNSPVEVSAFLAGTTPPTLTLTADDDIVVTGLCNVAATPTISGSEVLLGYRVNSVQPGIAYSYAKPGAGPFTSTLADSGGSAHSVFVSVAFKSYAGTAPPSGTVPAVANPRGISVTTKGDLQGFSTAPDRVPVGADGLVLTANSADPLGVSWEPGGAGAGGVIGTAQFSASGGSISNLVVSGCIANVTRTGVGAFTVSFSPNQTQFAVSALASDDATAATTIYLAGTPNLNSSLSSIGLQAVSLAGGGTVRDPGMVCVAIMKM